MKLIHCADLHLGSSLSSLPRELAEERKAAIRSSFTRMLDYAKENNVSIILLSGDVFDREKPYKKDLEFFYSAVEQAPKITFFYLRGNHDSAETLRALPNLKTFSEKWFSYSCGDLSVSGIELSPDNADSYHSTLSLNKDKKNVVMLHGQLGTDINLTKLRDKHIDYLALGHVHSYSDGQIDARGYYAYCGCLEGRGFDETGKKGFVLLNIEGNKTSYEFIPFSSKVIEEHRIDISGLLDTYSIMKKASDTVKPEKNGIYRLIFTGEIEAETDDFEIDVISHLKGYCAHLSVRDETVKKVDYTSYQNDLSLRGEFVRAVQASSDITEEDKAQIIKYGLKALSGNSLEYFNGKGWIHGK